MRWFDTLLARGCLCFLFSGSMAAGAAAQTLFDPILEVQPYVSGLLRPTSFAFLPVIEGAALELLVCEKETGRVIHTQGNAIVGTAVDVAVHYQSERGLLGIALHPDFGTSSDFVYVYFTPSVNGTDTNSSLVGVFGHRINRYSWNGSTLVSGTTILTLPSTPGPNHDGGVIVFGPDDKLYCAIGDLNRDGQLENFPLGSPPDDTAIICRLNDDGTAPNDNPFFSLGGAMQKVYAYGVRNSFGMDFDPITNALWDTENGPGSYDEVNYVLPGLNSGWEQIMGPDGRDLQGIADLWMAAGSAYSDPEFSWLTPVGVTSIHFVRSDVLGTHLVHDILMGDNNTGSLYLFEPSVDRTGLVMPAASVTDLVADNVAERNLFQFGSGFQVVTDIDTGPDGVYVASYLGNRILRISRRDTSSTGSDVANYRLAVFPNPTHRGTTLLLETPGLKLRGVELRIFSPAGRLVRTLHGDQRQSWNGRDDAGRRLAAGQYLARTSVAGQTLVTKITVLQ